MRVRRLALFTSKIYYTPHATPLRQTKSEKSRHSHPIRCLVFMIFSNFDLNSVTNVGPF